MELIDLHNLFLLYPPMVQRQVREHFATVADTIPQGEAYTLPTLDNINAGLKKEVRYSDSHHGDVYAVYRATISYVIVVDEVTERRRKRHTWAFDFDGSI